MFTTSLSHGRPYIFPHTESTARLFYQHDELAPYLPPEVMRWIDAHALEYVPSTRYQVAIPRSTRHKSWASGKYHRQIASPSCWQRG
jgi:hypothetical protein